ncbi:hypothetical protein SAMN05216404_101316 [Nitrosospira multiformis]|uniref:Uncharacterized protein n=1 Tax=Nitrosospira multiformis TaxID=1231 RepID=A0A1H8BQA7_9PROT|nr:hypothetical protein SAMN05216404_101316 [Nitrosospira multiformis]
MAYGRDALKLGSLVLILLPAPVNLSNSAELPGGHLKLL